MGHSRFHQALFGALAMLFLNSTLLPLGQVASAASFDCDQASSYVEKTICADSTLSQLDTRLGQLYAGTLAELSDSEPRSQPQAQEGLMRNVA